MVWGGGGGGGFFSPEREMSDQLITVYCVSQFKTIFKPKPDSITITQELFCNV